MKINRATLIQLWKKVTPFKTQEKVFWNGENNDYSEEIERVISNSPTGSRAKEMFSKFVYGDGLLPEQNPKINRDTYLSEVVKDVVDDVVIQNGFFVHTTYKVEDDGNGGVIFLPSEPKSLDYHKCRISEPDDDGNEGMILYKNYNKQDRSATKKEKDYKRHYYPYNPDQSVIIAQINADAKKGGYDGEDWAGKIKHYRGQVLYVNLTPKFRYAVSKFDSVFNDLDTEYRVGVYTNTMTRGGFMGKTAFLTQGLDAEQAESVKEDVQKWLSADGGSGIYHLDVEQVENLDNVMKIIQVPIQYDEKKFELTRQAMRRNILGAANNLPEGLAFSNDGALFAGSGESYNQMKAFYWEQCSWEREKVEEAFTKLGYEFKFIPLDEEKAKVANTSDKVDSDPEASEETLKAQATLRGSVGGVQGILGIQQSVGQGLTDFESAITILMEIYGFTRAVSSALLGRPEINTDDSINPE